MKPIVFSIAAILVCSFAAACGGGGGKSADPKATCEQIKKLKESGNSSVMVNDGFTIESCVTEKTEMKAKAGDEAFGDFYKCLKAGKTDDAIYDCEKSMYLAIEGAKLASADVESKIYEECSEMGQNQIVLERTDEAGASEWAFECHKKMMKVHKECDPKKAPKFLACLDREIDPDELATCVKECN
jgi:hypothetical protein